MDILYLQCFMMVISFTNVQELVQQSKFSNLNETKYRYTIEYLRTMNKITAYKIKNTKASRP